jgi:hypothetical protein
VRVVGGRHQHGDDPQRWLSLKNTRIAAAGSVDDAMEMLRSGVVDAFALTHDSLLAAARP